MGDLQATWRGQEGGAARQCTVQSNPFLTANRHQEQSAQEAGRWTTGLLEALEPKGQVFWQEMMGGIPGLLSAHLSCPQLALLSQGSSLESRPGCCLCSHARLGSAQLSWSQQRQPMCAIEGSSEGTSRGGSSICCAPSPSSGSCTHPCHVVPAPCSPPAPTIVRTMTVIIPKGHKALPECRTQFYWFPTFYQ